MHASERMIAAAEAAVAHETACSIAAVQRRLRAVGATTCVDCGDAIEPARWTAMPNARRCVGCQDDFDKAERVARGY